MSDNQKAEAAGDSARVRDALIEEVRKVVAALNDTKDLGPTLSDGENTWPLGGEIAARLGQRLKAWDEAQIPNANESSEASSVSLPESSATAETEEWKWTCNRDQPEGRRDRRIYAWPRHIGNAVSISDARAICDAHNACVSDKSKAPSIEEHEKLKEKLSCDGTNCGKCNDCLEVNLHFALMAVADQTSQKKALESRLSGLQEALIGLLNTGLKGADDYRLVLMACKRDALTAEEIETSEKFGRAVTFARAALSIQEEKETQNL